MSTRTWAQMINRTEEKARAVRYDAHASQGEIVMPRRIEIVEIDTEVPEESINIGDRTHGSHVAPLDVFFEEAIRAERRSLVMTKRFFTEVRMCEYSDFCG